MAGEPKVRGINAQSLVDNSSYLTNAEDTLQQKREKNIKATAQLKLTFINQLTSEEIKQLDKIKGISIQLANDVNNYKSKLESDYAVKVEKGLVERAEAEKEIARKTAIYLATEDHKRRKEQIKSDLSSFQDSLKQQTELNIKEYQNLLKQKTQASSKEEKDRLKKELKNNKAQAKELRKQRKQEYKQAAADMEAEGMSKKDILRTLADNGSKSAEFKLNAYKGVESAANNLINGLKQMFDSTIQSYGEYQRKINVRIQGIDTDWRGIEKNLKTNVGITPWIKTQQMMDNVVKATEQGITFNIEQRAFLETIKDSVAATFDAFDSNLTRIIKLQQADSTAARLGLEASLTKYLNAQYQDSSYLTQAFDTVSENLLEATSLMGAEQAVGFEYQVQKWLGSLSSVGFSTQAIGAISQALGQLGSGNVSGLAQSGAMQNLLVMAASRAGLNYSDLLTKGLTESTTNTLLESMVYYLQEIAESDNKVVKSEYARIFGMNVSDLSAVKNLIGEVNSIAKQTLDYSGAVSELYSQLSFSNMSSRVGIAGMLQNMMSNANYSIASGIAANPVTYALWQITSMVEDLTGGIALPTFSVMGNMVDLNTTVTNLMRAGIVGISSLGAIGQIISGIGNTADPSGMLRKLGITQNLSTTSRGSGLNRRAKLLGATSGSTFIGNTAGSDYYESTMTSANEDVDRKAKTKKQENTDITLNNIHEYMLRIFDPKFTELERLVALIAGYNSSDIKTGANTTFGTFNSDSNGQYFATAISINGDAARLGAKTAQLESISNNVSTIVELLRNGIDVKMSQSTPTSMGGTGMQG